MALSNGPLALILLGLALVLVLAASRPRATRARLLPVAHAERLTRLPEFHAGLRRASVRLAAGCAALLLAGAAALIGVARPVETLTENTARHARDVMLCLDASGSMAADNSTILGEYDALVNGFEGERIGLTLFDSTALQAFPLTDDYDLVRETIGEVRTGFDSFGTEGMNFLPGTYDGVGSSLIGDGLAACVANFDERGEERSRSIIFASDNLVAGQSIFTLPEAAELAKEQGIRVYVLAPLISDVPTDTRTRELHDVATDTGGTLYSLDNVDPDAIVEDIQATQAALVRGDDTTVLVDRSAVPLTVTTVLIVSAYVLLWRSRL